jgi:dihydroneopterin triphosphate diphosphatase
MNIRHDMIQCFAVRAAGDSHEFLQLRRAAGDYMGGTWQTVFGQIEAGETAWRAALRELKEEAGLAAEELYRLDWICSFYIDVDDTLWHCPVFCAIVSPQAQVRLNREHDAFRWLPRESAAGSFLWPSDRQAVGQIGAEILDGGAAKEYMRINMM